MGGRQRHLLPGAGVDGDGNGLGFQQRRQPGCELVAAVPEADFRRHRHAPGTPFGRPNHRLSQGRLLAQRRAGAAFLHVAVRASHIDVNTVETQFGRQCRCPFHGVRLGAEQLHHNGPLAFRVGQAAQQAVAARAHRGRRRR